MLLSSMHGCIMAKDQGPNVNNGLDAVQAKIRQ